MPINTIRLVSYFALLPFFAVAAPVFSPDDGAVIMPAVQCEDTGDAAEVSKAVLTELGRKEIGTHTELVWVSERVDLSPAIACWLQLGARKGLRVKIGLVAGPDIVFPPDPPDPDEKALQDSGGELIWIPPTAENPRPTLLTWKQGLRLGGTVQKLVGDDLAAAWSSAAHLLGE